MFSCFAISRFVSSTTKPLSPPLLAVFCRAVFLVGQWFSLNAQHFLWIFFLQTSVLLKKLLKGSSSWLFGSWSLAYENVTRKCVTRQLTVKTWKVCELWMLSSDPNNLALCHFAQIYYQHRGPAATIDISQPDLTYKEYMNKTKLKNTSSKTHKSPAWLLITCRFAYTSTENYFSKYNMNPVYPVYVKSTCHSHSGFEYLDSLSYCMW